MIKKLTNVQDYEAAVASDFNKNRKSLVIFKATWCHACDGMKKKINDLSYKAVGVDFYDIDVDEVGEVFEKLKVEAVPTFKLFENGKEIVSAVGSLNDLMSYLK